MTIKTLVFVAAAGSSLAFTAACAGTQTQAAAPDAVFVNATVITMDPAGTTAEAVALRDGRIAAVGSNADIRKLAAAATRVVDLQGQTLLPGFIDAHSHFPGAGTTALYHVNLSSPPLGPIESLDDMVGALKAKAAETPKGGWIQGRGYDQTLLKEGRHPTRQDLDRASAEHPIFITHASGHLSVANSMALKLANLTKASPNPKGGVIQKDPKTGELTGLLEESGNLVGRLIPRLSEEQQQAAIKWAVTEYASHGVTTATLAGGGLSPAMRTAGKAGVIPFRVVAMGGLSGDLSALPPSKLDGDEMMKTGLTVKMVHDGSIQGFTGYLTKPYHTVYNNDPAYRGYPRESREELIEKVKALNRGGYQIAIHANGDEAIEDVIVAYREALKELPRPDHRWRIEHAQMTREDQLDAIKELGVSPSFFVSHTYYWGDQHRDIFQGPERGAHISALASARQRGIRFSIHLDTAVTPMRPLGAVWSAVNRITRSGKVLGADQRIAPIDALRAVTIDAAWQEHDDKIKGSIEAGKLADFVVLAENPLTVDPVHIKDIKVVQTIVGGQTIYTAGSTGTR